MAITQTTLTSGTSSGAASSSHATASVTPTSGRAVFISVAAAISAGTVTVNGISGCGLTWSEIIEQPSVSGGRTVAVWKGVGTPSAGAITITLSASATAAWVVDEYAAANASNPAVQSVGGNSNSTTSLTVTLGAFASSANATFGAMQIGVGTGTNVSPGGGFSEIAEPADSTAPAVHLETEWRSDNDTTVDWSWTGSFNVSGVAIEIAAATAGGTYPPIVVSQSVPRSAVR